MNATNATSIISNSTSISSSPAVAHSTLVVFGILQLTLSSVASILSVVLIAATTLPLFFPETRKNYSNYNLYLAYLSIPDLVMNISVIYFIFANTQWTLDDTTTSRESSNHNDYNAMWFDAHPYDDAIYPLCGTSNLYTNAFLTLQIYKLLKNSNARKRSYPPTIGKVTQHAMISYGMGISIYIVEVFVIAHKFDNNTWASAGVLETLYWLFSWSFCVVIPLSVLVGVSSVIFCKKLIVHTQTLYEGRLRVLSLFYLRIMIIDLMIWLPSSILFTMHSLAEDKKTRIIAYNSMLLFFGIQVMVNFRYALTKPDTRTLIENVLAFVYCRKDWRESEANRMRQGTDSTDDSEDGRRDPFLRSIFRHRSSISSEATRAMAFSMRSIQSHTQSRSRACTNDFDPEEQSSCKNVTDKTVTFAAPAPADADIDSRCSSNDDGEVDIEVEDQLPFHSDQNLTDVISISIVV